MSTCAKCQHAVIEGRLADGATVLLEPGPRTYVAVEEHHLFPEDGDRVFLSASLVEHAVLCPGARRDQAAARAAGTATHQRREAAKKGVAP